MHRLKKLAMDTTMFQSSVDQVSKKGRDLLKSLEDFKFTLEQTARLLNNNQDIAQGMIQKRKNVDEITSKLYQIVFDIENMDISQSYTENQPITQRPDNNVPKDDSRKPVPGQPPAGIPVPNNAAPTPPQPGAEKPKMPEVPKDDEKSKDDSKKDSKEDSKEDSEEE